MLSKFFILRPIFATVVSIIVITMGVTALVKLPIAQYPELAPPTIAVKANYPGADAKVVADTVAAPIEQEVNGVEKMLYMSSISASDGSYTLILVTDNDFSVTQNGSGTQFDVCTSGVNGSGTSQQVALGAACPAGMTLIPNMIYSFRLSEAEFNALATAVPEPATWTLMLTGFGLVAAAARRRRKVPVRFV